MTNWEEQRGGRLAGKQMEKRNEYLMEQICWKQAGRRPKFLFFFSILQHFTVRSVVKTGSRIITLRCCLGFPPGRAHTGGLRVESKCHSGSVSFGGVGGVETAEAEGPAREGEGGPGTG